MKTNAKRATLIAVICLIYLLASAAPTNAQQRRTGEWQQFAWNEFEHHWQSLGTFLVYKEQGKYLMKPVDQVKAPDITNSLGLSDVHFRARRWTFKSDWGNGEIATFRLTRIGKNVYRGWAYLKSKPQTRNLWLLVK
jgi:hypothetical protein